MGKKRNPSIVIIGAGMTGILMTIKLREAGFTDLTILEKTDRIGGTWRENTYPGVACDVPAHMYTYSFEPNPEWSHRFAHGSEIQEYFERVARKYGVSNSISFNEAVTSANYDSGKWTVGTSKGRTIIADFVINCTGILHHPAYPDIKGLESFEGTAFHTARWNHDVDLRGKRVGIIGTGSTAAQIIPEVAKQAKHFSVFQRTPQWFFPIPNKAISDKRKAAFRKNPNKMQRLRKAYLFSFSQLFTKAVTGHKVQNFFFSKICQLYLRFAVKDPVLREKLTPKYRVGCKRIIVSTSFYDAVQQPHVDLVTEGIEEVTAKGVRTKDGKEHELDVLVLSTGFDPTSYMRPMNMTGKDGEKIDDAWSNKILTYRSLFMPGFPNNFLMLGPNTPIGNYSVIAMSEVQCNYLIKIIDRWRGGVFDEIDVSQNTAKNFLEYIRKGMKNTVWLGGCNSWYLDKDGDPILWPYTWEKWVGEMAEPQMSDFLLKRFEEEETDESWCCNHKVAAG